MERRPLTDEQILEKYRGLYPYLSEDQIAELRDRNRRLLLITFRQIDRLKHEGRWPQKSQHHEIRASDDQAV